MIESLKIPNVFRDVIFLIGGFASLLFLNINLNLNLLRFVNSLYLGRIELDLTVIVLSFIWGKVLHFISILLLDFIDLLINSIQFTFLDRRPFKQRWLIFKSEWRSPQWKTKISNFLYPKNFFDPVFTEDVKREINIVEISEVFNKHPNLAGNSERSIYNSILLRMILSTSVIAGLCISTNYFIVSFVVLYSLITLNRSMNHEYRSIIRAIVKENSKSK